MSKIIAISGNIGSGKTTLAKNLSAELGWESILEDALENPYISDFYEQMGRWSFNMQVYYLQSRFEQILKIHKSKVKFAVQDRTIYEDAFIFAPSLYDMGLMSDRDFRTYQELFKLVDSLIQPPDLVIYIRSSAPKLLEQIKKRGRKFEFGVSEGYLQRLNERYEAWIHNYPHNHVVIDGETYNFSDNKRDLDSVIGIINRSL